MESKEQIIQRIIDYKALTYFGYNSSDIGYKALEDMLKENEELHKQVDIEFVEENYIEKSKVVSKDKIRTKIKELKESRKSSCRNACSYCVHSETCEILTELLGE